MLSAFLESLFDEGDVTFRAAPVSPTPDAAAADAVLARAFADYRLEIAGPLIKYDPAAARAAAEFVWWTCWFLVHRDADADEVRQRLKASAAPRTAAQHLSADLTFRHLPQLHRRARALSPDDVLTTTIAEAMRTWPLSGVASEIEEPPMAPLDFADHPGLEMLYAERYVRLPRENWLPSGRAAEYVELLLNQPPR